MNAPLSVRSAVAIHNKLESGGCAAIRVSREGIDMNRSRIVKGVAAAVASAMALSAVGVAAQAQPYGQSGYYGNPPAYGGYDPCRREANNRGITGALVGGGMGAVIGSQVAANHHRSDGSLVGGLLGAVVGASVGKGSAACNQAPPPPPVEAAPPPPAPPPVAYYEEPVPAPPPVVYYEEPPPPPPARYDNRYWAYGHHGERFRIAERRAGADGCTLAESPIYLPDGRIQKRFVRVCMDSDGRYQVVD
jgi:hypothetical protein